VRSSRTLETNRARRPSRWRRRSNECFAHSIDLCEVFYDFHRASGLADAMGALRDVALAGVVERNDMNPELWHSEGTLKSVHRRISLADCFALALSQKLDATLLTSDRHELGALTEQVACSIQFIR
jgi:hypothetical protein